MRKSTFLKKQLKLSTARGKKSNIDQIPNHALYGRTYKNLQNICYKSQCIFSVLLHMILKYYRNIWPDGTKQFKKFSQYFTDIGMKDSIQLQYSLIAHISRDILTKLQVHNIDRSDFINTYASTKFKEKYTYFLF